MAGFQINKNKTRITTFIANLFEIIRQSNRQKLRAWSRCLKSDLWTTYTVINQRVYINTFIVFKPDRQTKAQKIHKIDAHKLRLIFRQKIRYLSLKDTDKFTYFPFCHEWTERWTDISNYRVASLLIIISVGQLVRLEYKYIYIKKNVDFWLLFIYFI